MTAAGEKAISISEIESLLALACSGLKRMVDPGSGLFCYTWADVGGEIRRGGASGRYSAMTLLGLHRYHQLGFESGFSIQDMADAMLRDANWGNDVGDAGLLLWLFAEIDPSRLEQCFRATDLTSLVQTSDLLRTRHTMELSWLLTGLSKAVAADSSLRTRWGDQARLAHELLMRNRGRSGFFGHRSSSFGPSSWRGRIGSFADQVYPIFALTNYAKAFGVTDALDTAVVCADGICRAQGQLGQWWWHYDSGSGRVVQRYPVYSVHQEAMGPMALLEVGGAAGRDLSAPLLKGLAWIYGRNELNVDMRDRELGVVWRCQKLSGIMQMLRQELPNWRKEGREPVSVSGLSVLRECRPYELGWLLFALSEYVARRRLTA